MPNFIITEDNRKFDLDKARDLDLSTREEHGTNITGVYKTKSGKVIVGTYSIWERGHTGMCIGQQYHVADADEIASLAKRFDNEALMAKVPLAE